MSLVMNESLTGGQVPLLKHRIMEYLLQHRSGDKGHVPAAMNTYWFVEKTKASPSNVNRAMWDLQKQGLITFREAKRSGTNGHASTTVLDRVNITPKGLDWKQADAITDVGVQSLTEDDWDPAFKEDVAVSDVTDEMGEQAYRARRTRFLDLIAPRLGRSAACTCGHPKDADPRDQQHFSACPYKKQQDALHVMAEREAKALRKGREPVEAIVDRVMHTLQTTMGPEPDYASMAPLEALVEYLRWTFATTGEDRVKIVPDANEALGYARTSTAMYSLLRTANEMQPGMLFIEKGAVGLTPEGRSWRPNLDPQHGGGRRRATTEGIRSRDPVAPTPVSTPETGEARMWEEAAAYPDLVEEARASVALDHDPDEGTHYEGDGHDHRKPLVIGPEITALMARADKRKAVSEAVAALERAGLEDDALQIMSRIPDDSPLEREVLALIEGLSNG